MPMLLCLVFICSFIDYVPEQCEELATQEDFTDTGVGCIDDCLEPAE